MSEVIDLFGNQTRPKPPKWRCLPSQGHMAAAKVPLPIMPPAKYGQRRVRVVDSFAGGGGASNGVRSALLQLHVMGLLPLGHPLDVDYAINHDDAALAMHLANHPETIHLPANVWQVSMRETLGDDIFGLLWLSPDCRDHSPAKGGPITSRAVRDLAWVLVKWLKELPDWQRPWVICLENVGAFSKWSPLIDRADGMGFERDPERIGHTFHQFVHEVTRYGYSAGWKEIVACEFGNPTIRKRLKLVFRRDGKKATWAKPTHGNPKSDAVKSGKLQPWPVAADIIDFERPCPSIFLTKEEAKEYTKTTGVRIIRPLAFKTDARIAKGVHRHVLEAGDDAFIVTINHSGDGFRGQSTKEPFSTVTRARDAHGLIVPHVSAYYGDGGGGKDRSAPVEEPVRVVPTEPRHAVVETTIVPHVTVFRGDQIGRSIDEAAPTITANSFIKRPGGASPIGIAETTIVPHVMTMRNSGKPTSAANEPTHTVTAGGAGLSSVEATVAPFVSRAQHGGGNRSAQEPHHTVAASDGDQNQVVAVYMAQHNTGEEGHSVERPVSTIVQKGCTQGVVTATFIKREFGNSVGSSMKVPVGAVTAGGGGKTQTVAAHMLSLKGSERRDGPVEDPHPAVCASGQHSAVVTVPLMTAYYSTGGQDAAIDDPMLAVPTRARFGLTHADLTIPPLSDEQLARARQVAVFLRLHGCWDDREFVTVDIRGTTFIVVDIGMRMLTPRELARAQGFPDSYILAAPFRGGFLSETEQRHKIGNSVCELPAKAVIVENYRPPMDWAFEPVREAAE